MSKIKIIMVLAISVLLTAKTASAANITLEFLLGDPSRSITVEDKLFNNFREFRNPGVTANPADIMVDPAPAGFGIGLEFFTNKFNVPSPPVTPGTWIIGPNSVQTTSFKYDVTVLPPNENLISDNDLRIFFGTGTGTFTITERVFEDEDSLIAVLDKDGNPIENIVNNTPFSEAIFGTPLSRITVFTTIDLDTTGSGNPNEFSFIGDYIQTFSQVPVQAPVPEPATLLLLASGLAGLGFIRWRKIAA